jgi:hypothetical protein
MLLSGSFSIYISFELIFASSTLSRPGASFRRRAPIKKVRSYEQAEGGFHHRQAHSDGAFSWRTPCSLRASMMED